MSSVFSEFKTFIAKGNVIDLAVGIVIGGAFAKLVDGVVKGIIEPMIAVLTGKGTPDTILLGIFAFGGGVLNFLLLAAVVFFVFVKPINKLKALERSKEPPAPPPGPTQEQILLEIRDLLKK